MFIDFLDWHETCFLKYFLRGFACLRNVGYLVSELLVVDEQVIFREYNNNRD
jgi:hypothetical protein